MILKLPGILELSPTWPGLSKAMICKGITLKMNDFERPWHPGAPAELARPLKCKEL